jgi:hypothetical protein
MANDFRQRTSEAVNGTGRTYLGRCFADHGHLPVYRHRRLDQPLGNRIAGHAHRPAAPQHTAFGGDRAPPWLCLQDRRRCFLRHFRRCRRGAAGGLPDPGQPRRRALADEVRAARAHRAAHRPGVSERRRLLRNDGQPLRPPAGSNAWRADAAHLADRSAGARILAGGHQPARYRHASPARSAAPDARLPADSSRAAAEASANSATPLADTS